MTRNRIARAAMAGIMAAGIALTGTAHAEGDAAKGEKVFRKCKACHAVGDDAKHRVGPALNGILDRAAGEAEGFRYSDAMLESAAGGLVWDAATLGAFLSKPKEVVPGTKMSFAGLRKEQEVADVIAFLAANP